MRRILIDESSNRPRYYVEGSNVRWDNYTDAQIEAEMMDDREESNE